MSNISIVTAFYDIGRENWNYWSRSNDFYFECFERLCKLKNKIIVFSQKKFKHKFDYIINNIKQDLIVLYEDDVINENAHLLQLISKVQKSSDYTEGILTPNCPEYWCPEYVLINFLKSKFCLSAIQKFLDIDETVAWIDFGYVKKDSQIPESKIWKYNFEDKIHMWNILDIPQNLDLIKTIKSNTVYIQGCHIVCSKEKWFLFSGLMEQQMQTLISNNLIDDDQTLMLMSYLKSPSEFNIHREYINSRDLDWFFIFQYYNKECDLNYFLEMEKRV